jgi:hypothetical protein
MRKESCHPLMAIVVAALEAGILEGGLVEPLHMSQKDCAGSVMRSTIQHGVVSYADENDDRDFQFPLHIVITDELRNGVLELDIETKKVGCDWTFHTQASWNASGSLALNSFIVIGTAKLRIKRK